MSATEILISLFGLFIGYWVVAKLVLGGGRKPAPPEQAPASGVHDSGDEEGAAPWNEILQVSPQAPAEEIRQAYRSLISQYHPDKVAGLGDELKALAERKSAQINGAYRQAMLERGTQP